MIKIKIFLTVLLLAIVTSGCINSEDETRTPAIPSLISSFYEKYETKGVKPAIDYILSENKWIELNDLKKDSVITEIQNLSNSLGMYYGHEIIKYKKFGNSYTVVSTIAKYDRQAIRYNFILYKPRKENTDWQMQKFNYDLDIEDELMDNVSISYDF
ncbi:MAG: hypothetical protein ABJN84_05150 [Flavobacteriaceae bacterium]